MSLRDTKKNENNYHETTKREDRSQILKYILINLTSDLYLNNKRDEDSDDSDEGRNILATNTLPLNPNISPLATKKII